MNGYESNTTHNYLWELNLLVKPLQKHLQFHCHSKRFWSNRNLSSEWRNWLTVLWIKPFQLNNKREVELRLSHVAVKIIFLPRHVTTIMLHPKWYVRIQRHLSERKSKGGRPREKSRILTDTQNTKKKQLLKKIYYSKDVKRVTKRFIPVQKQKQISLEKSDSKDFSFHSSSSDDETLADRVTSEKEH